MSDLTATRDLVIIGILAYAAYKLKSPFKEAQDAVGAAAQKAGDVYHFYSAGGELAAASAAAQVGKTDTGLTDDYTDYWNKYFQGVFGRNAPPVDSPITAHDPSTGAGMQETVQILPHPPAAITPEFTPEIERMLFAPAPDRPPVHIFPPTDIPAPVRTPAPQQLTPIIRPIVPPVTELIRRPAPAPTPSPTYDTRPLDSMTPGEAAAGGYVYSGAIGWYR